MTRILKSSKKANAIIDSLVWVIIIAVFAVMAVVGVKIVSELGPEIRTELVESSGADNSSVELFDEVTNRYPSIMDGAVLLGFLLLWVVVIVASFMLDSHPLFFVVSIVLLIGVLAVGAALQTFYEELIVDSELAGIDTQLPMTHWVMSHIFILILMVAGSVLLALYGKNAIQ